MNVYKGKLLKKMFKSSNRSLWLVVLSTLLTTWLSNIAFYLLLMWLQILVEIDSRITPDIVSKLLHATISSHCAVLFESEQTPFPQTGRWFTRIQTCCFAQDSIWNMLFESEQTPFPQTGRWFTRIQTCCFAQDSIWNMLFCSYVIFLLRNQWMIERLS